MTSDCGLQDGRKSVKLKPRELASLGLKLSPFLFAKPTDMGDAHGFQGEITGKKRKTEDNKAYIQFHYDLSNDFYALFLDPEMVYSCAYYTDWSNGVEQAQRDKLEMICRKLRLKAGDRMLDIGAGWGGLLCHAAVNYGVTAHGVTLSEEQLAFARNKAKRLGIDDRVTFELSDYSKVTGTYDKIASIGMYEHIGLKNIPAYMSKVRSLSQRRRLVPQSRDLAPCAEAQGKLAEGRHAPRKESDCQIHFPRRRIGRHRPLDCGHGTCRIRSARRRRLAPPLRAHLSALVRTPDRQ